MFYFSGTVDPDRKMDMNMDMINGTPAPGESNGQDLLEGSVYSDGGYIPRQDLKNGGFAAHDEDEGPDLEGYQPTYAEAFPPLPSAPTQDPAHQTPITKTWRKPTGPIRSTTITQASSFFVSLSKFWLPGFCLFLESFLFSFTKW